MKLIIKEGSKLPIKFINYLIIQIRSYLLQNCYNKKLINAEKYLNNIFPINKHISCATIMRLAAYNLYYYINDEDLIITINENIFYENTSLKVFLLCKIINFGTLDLYPVSIFYESFNFVANNIVKYYEEFSGR